MDRYDDELDPPPKVGWLTGLSIACRTFHGVLTLADPKHCAHISTIPIDDTSGVSKCQTSVQDTSPSFYMDGYDNVVLGIGSALYGLPLGGVTTDCVGGADGDPHFLDWSNNFYDYMGVCDLVLLDAPGFVRGLGLTTHIRTKARYQYSYIEAAAVKIGDEIFEVGSFGTWFLNGVEGVEMPAFISGFPISHEQPTKKDHVFTVDLKMHGKVTIKTHKDLVGIKFENTAFADFSGSVGLMGSYGNGTHYARDGKTIMKDANAFGEEWQVQKDEPALFAAGPTTSGKCVLPTPPTNSERRLGETIHREEAERVCANHQHEFEQCVYDVIATGDLGAATAGIF